MKDIRTLCAYVLPRRRQLCNGVALGKPVRDRMLESLCVVAIVMLLLAFALDSYLPALKRFMLVEATNLTVGYKERIAETMAVQGVMPQTIELQETAQRPLGRNVARAVWQDEEIVFTLGARTANGMMPDAGLAGAPPLTLSYRMARSATGDRLVLLCGFAAAPPGFTAAAARHTTVPALFLPHHCRH
jgi:type II secretory pathway pseudopilin PulG